MGWGIRGLRAALVRLQCTVIPASAKAAACEDLTTLALARTVISSSAAVAASGNLPPYWQGYGGRPFAERFRSPHRNLASAATGCEPKVSGHTQRRIFRRSGLRRHANGHRATSRGRLQRRSRWRRSDIRRRRSEEDHRLGLRAVHVVSRWPVRRSPGGIGGASDDAGQFECVANDMNKTNGKESKCALLPQF